MNSQCPACNSQNEFELMPDWSEDGMNPVECGMCHTIYVATVNIETEHSGVVYKPATMTDMPIATNVFMHNKDHELHLRRGVIIDKDFLYYRVKFKNGPTIRVPYNVIRRVPKKGD